jgi:hypothetical protein
MWRVCKDLKGGGCEFYFEAVLQIVMKNTRT